MKAVVRPAVRALLGVVVTLRRLLLRRCVLRAANGALKGLCPQHHARQPHLGDDGKQEQQRAKLPDVALSG